MTVYYSAAGGVFLDTVLLAGFGLGLGPQCRWSSIGGECSLGSASLTGAFRDNEPGPISVSDGVNEAKCALPAQSSGLSGRHSRRGLSG